MQRKVRVHAGPSKRMCGIADAVVAIVTPLERRRRGRPCVAEYVVYVVYVVLDQRETHCADGCVVEEHEKVRTWSVLGPRLSLCIPNCFPVAIPLELSVHQCVQSDFSMGARETVRWDLRLVSRAPWQTSLEFLHASAQGLCHTSTPPEYSTRA